MLDMRAHQLRAAPVTMRQLEADAGWLAFAVAFALLPLVVVLWAAVGVWL
jgi:hypothetical protein